MEEEVNAIFHDRLPYEFQTVSSVLGRTPGNALKKSHMESFFVRSDRRDDTLQRRAYTLPAICEDEDTRCFEKFFGETHARNIFPAREVVVE
ncbi:hypothetical protein HY213_03735 [Candidatus Peregrinibacteria bacterium]|nr:hypothetical protein [Candidatus Peregrinibacteria bacterium]